MDEEIDALNEFECILGFLNGGLGEHVRVGLGALSIDWMHWEMIRCSRRGLGVCI